MIDKVTAWKRLNSLGVTKTMAEIEAALDTIEQQAIFNEERSRITVEVWDKVSPINGVDPATVKTSLNVPEGGEVYMLYIDGNLSILQPYDPFQAGIVPMTADNVLTIANQYADQLAWQFADEKIFDRLLEALL